MDSNTIIAVCALFTSVMATGLAAWSGYVQWKHMKLSVRPLAGFSVGDYEDCLGVWLANKGLGPFQIATLQVADSRGLVENSIIPHMPSLIGDVHWSNFRDNSNGTAVEKGKKIELILLKGDPESIDFQKSRDEVRRALMGLTLILEYKDLYGKPMPRVEYKLSWFGRLLS